MAPTAPIQQQMAKRLSQKSKATIAALASLFTTTGNDTSITPPHTLWSAIQTTYKTALSTFSLPEDATRPLSHASAATRVTNAVFDTDAKLFFDGPRATLFASLSTPAKARLLAQAIAGMVLFFVRLAGAAEAGEVSEAMLARELEAFRASEEREAALNGVEDSAVWERCADRKEIARLVSRVVDRAADEAEVAEMVESELNGAMGFDLERPRNMGLPWGFSILPVN